MKYFCLIIKILLQTKKKYKYLMMYVYCLLLVVEGTVSLTYFILEGQCCVLQTVQLSKGCGRYPGYCVHPTDGSPSETFIVRTCMLTRRGVFGLGQKVRFVYAIVISVVYLQFTFNDFVRTSLRNNDGYDGEKIKNAPGNSHSHS